MTHCMPIYWPIPLMLGSTFYPWSFQRCSVGAAGLLVEIILAGRCSISFWKAFLPHLHLFTYENPHAMQTTHLHSSPRHHLLGILTMSIFSTKHVRPYVWISIGQTIVSKRWRRSNNLRRGIRRQSFPHWTACYKSSSSSIICNARF